MAGARILSERRGTEETNIFAPVHAEPMVTAGLCKSSNLPKMAGHFCPAKICKVLSKVLRLLESKMCTGLHGLPFLSVLFDSSGPGPLSVVTRLILTQANGKVNTRPALFNFVQLPNQLACPIQEHRMIVPSLVTRAGDIVFLCLSQTFIIFHDLSLTLSLLAMLHKGDHFGFAERY